MNMPIVFNKANDNAYHNNNDNSIDIDNIKVK